jgi:hypothetical protein
MTLKKMTLSKNVIYSIKNLCHYAEYRILFIIILNVVMLNVIMQTVVAPFMLLILNLD